ncbi:L,D-transpeptidase family protein [Sphingomonas sp. JC676]|nr:L,D-transpeptidase family protein [Sphingomonas sp. JC676]
MFFAVPAIAGDGLRPGQYVWYDRPQLIRASTVPSQISITVSLPDQRAYVYRDGEMIGMTTVSTGARGRATPVGNYTILQKKPFHRSNLYSNAPMPFMQRLTWSGIAMHAGHLPGYPASHGCIRMPRAFAEQLYSMTDLGVAVSVVAHRIENVPAFPAQTATMIADNKSSRRRAAAAAEAALVDIDLEPIPYPSPMILADTSALSGDAFDVLTMGGDPPAVFEPAVWTSAPVREIVQPIPARK